jgi:glycosyltransferase involved in cell wall biosynthesis
MGYTDRQVTGLTAKEVREDQHVAAGWHAQVRSRLTGLLPRGFTFTTIRGSLRETHMHEPYSSSIAVNSRYRLHRITGVQRYAHEITSRLSGYAGARIEELAPRSAKGAAGHFWEQTALPAAAAGRRLWSPSGTGPALYRNQIVTFHDLFALEHPEWYGRAYAKWYGALLPRLAKRAAGLIAVSEYTKSRIVTLLGRDPDEITVVPNGLTTGCRRASRDEIAVAASALRLPSSRYVLSLSSLEKRKNLRTTLAAWERIHAKLPQDMWLVLAGPEADPNVYGYQQLSVNLPRVYFTGYVPEANLAGLYSGASVFVFPSLAEGFGLPLLEAMACGVRCVTANNSSLPEVGGDVARYVDALDDAALAEAIWLELAADDGTPFEPAMERARRFSWDHAAMKTWALLQAADLHGARTSLVRETKRHAD